MTLEWDRQAPGAGLALLAASWCMQSSFLQGELAALEAAVPLCVTQVAVNRPQL